MARSGSQARVTVMVQEADPLRRIALLDALRGAFVALPVEEGRDLVREVRSRRPELVLLGLGPSSPERALRASRALRSDPAPCRVGLLHPGGRGLRPEALLEASLANGLLVGALERGRLLPWVERLLAGETAVDQGPPRRGILGRILGKTRQD